MKKLFFTLLMNVAFVCGFAQQADSIKKEDDYDKTFTMVEKEASFPGGIKGWSKYLELNLNAELGGKYIRLKKNEKMAQQTVAVQFIVDKQGKISHVKTINHSEVHAKLANEAERVIKAGPDWIPAELRGRKVLYLAMQKITFQVEREQ